MLGTTLRVILETPRLVAWGPQGWGPKGIRTPVVVPRGLCSQMSNYQRLGLGKITLTIPTTLFMTSSYYLILERGLRLAGPR